MIYVTHDQVEAMTLATRVAVMRGGRIQQIGTPGEVYARPANMFVAGFLGSPSMNFIEGMVTADAAAKQGTTPTAAVLGVRPEHIALHAGGDAFPSAEVTLVETMGAHEVVWLDMQGHKLAAIAPATGRHGIGSMVGVQMDLERASVFDPKTEERVELHASAFYHRPH
jgi:multiple sugar transport system ATP-binding protein